LPHPRLADELALSPQDFNRKFKASPVQRARRRGYLRNIAVALGNAYAGSKDLEAVNALAQALQRDPEPLVRLHAAWALAQVGGQAARQALIEAFQTEVDPSVRCEIEAVGLINNY
jgi:epoxyqueuosine reductase